MKKNHCGCFKFLLEIFTYILMDSGLSILIVSVIIGINKKLEIRIKMNEFSTLLFLLTQSCCCYIQYTRLLFYFSQCDFSAVLYLPTYLLALSFFTILYSLLLLSLTKVIAPLAAATNPKMGSTALVVSTNSSVDTSPVMIN